MLIEKITKRKIAKRRAVKSSNMETWYVLMNVVLIVNVIILIMSNNKNAFVWFCIRMCVIAIAVVLYIKYIF